MAALNQLISGLWTPSSPVPSLFASRATALDHYIAIPWCLLVALLNYHMAECVLFRWPCRPTPISIILHIFSFVSVALLLQFLVLSIWDDSDQPAYSWLLLFIISLPIYFFLSSSFFSTSAYYRRLSMKENRDDSLSMDPLPTPASSSSSFSPSSRRSSMPLKHRIALILLTIAGLISTAGLLHQESTALYEGSSSLSALTQYEVNSNGTILPELSDPSKVRFLLIIFSSWTESGIRHRKTFRESTLKLLPTALKANPGASLAYKFILGNVPSAQVRREMGPAVDAENNAHGDILIVPTSDRYEDLSRKAYGAYAWAKDIQFDYLLKSDDDCFLRLDTIISENTASHPQHSYWRGLAYHDIPPIHDPSNKNSAWNYQLPLFPPYVAGALYILSRDIIQRIVSPGPRMYTKNEDQNLGIWLFPLNIRPIHDRRIQQADVCEDDMLAKHFSDSFESSPNGLTPKDMAENVLQGRRMCEGFNQIYCGYCYPCEGRSNHWRDWGYDCDDVRGVSLLATTSAAPSESSKATGSPGTPSESQIDALVIQDPPVQNQEDKKDAWIIPGLLHLTHTPMSDQDNWSSLYWAAWTTGPESFRDIHHRTLELVFAHTPNAKVILLSSTLPKDFFDLYTQRGYSIHVIPASSEDFLRNEWWTGPKTEAWVRRMDEWSKGANYFSHLTDYIRYVMLYRYGGTYMDMDALWIQAPPNPDVQFIGGDHSSLESDLDWTLDSTGLYLAPGVMRLRRGWKLLRQISEDVFNPDVYSPDCFNCVGPRAITGHVKPQRSLLVQVGGLHILPTHVLYPKNYLEAHTFLEPTAPSPDLAVKDPAMAKVQDLLDQGTWSIHLFGKMTKGMPVQAGSVVNAIFKRWALYISGEHAGVRRPLEVHGPPFIETTATSRPVAFRGALAILVRGGEVPQVDQGGRIMLRIQSEGGWLSWGDGGPEWKSMEMEGADGSYASVNTLLSRLQWARSESTGQAQPSGMVRIEVGMGEETVVYRCKVWTSTSA